MKTNTKISFLARTARLARATGARAALTLLLLLVSTTTAWAGYKLSQAPMGNIDGCEGGRLAIRVWGWTCDPYYETKDLAIELDCPAEEWDKVKGRDNWYLKAQNRAEIHVLKDGVEVNVVSVFPNVKRNDVVDAYKFYTEPRHYQIIEERPPSHQSLSVLLWAFVQPVEYDYYKSFDREMGFDTWIGVDEPGTYHVVAYGLNVHGDEEKTRLLGERDVTVENGYAITYDANTTDNVSNMPGPTYKSQVANSVTIPESTWDVERRGYTFIGWNTEPKGDGTFYRPGTETDCGNADLKLYAQWVRSSFFAWNWYGYATVDRTSTISSVDDWNDLATMVNNGYLHGKTITLANDIGDENNPITRCIGTERYPFDNHFNGNGHTIYVDIDDTSREGTAPFRYVGLCAKWQDKKRENDRWTTWSRPYTVWQISMLKVKGTVRGGKYCSGLVGISEDADVFLCAVQADVITNSTHCAGVIGYARSYSKTKTTCCVFSGSISGATQQTGIFIGALNEKKESRCYSCLSTATVSGANIDFAPYSEVTNCFKTTNLGKQGTYTPNDPAAIIPKMVALSINGTPYYWSQDDDGSIIPFHQVYIDNASHWNAIATRIANGASFKGRQLILRKDITVGTMLGTEEHPFDGDFDGQNHKLTFNLTTAESGCAPFRYIKNAKIKNLKIDGTLEHSVGAKTRLAGVAAYTSGNNNGMEHITVNSTIRSQASSFHHAGLVAQINDGRVIFLNCAFKGKLLCDGNSSGCGGLVAVNMGNGTGFQNCLFAPTECTVGTDKSCTISRDIKEPSIIINTCYTQELGDLQGTRAYTVATVPDNVFCYLWKGPDNVNYYQAIPTYIGGLQHTYNYNNGEPIDIDYSLYCYQNLLDAEKYTATIRKATDNTEVTEVTEIGQYTLAITANEGSGYHGTAEQAFYVTASSLPMNDKGHFLINSADDWNKLCELTSYDHQAEYQFFEGRVVELTADITVTQQLGFFCGTLAGNGHTLTFNLGTAQSPFTRDGAAPIYNLRGNAIIENLHINGTIITSTGRFAAGLVGLVGSEESAQHHVRINNCRSSIRIKTTYNGACHNGGFVGYANNGKLYFNNCLFDGCFTSEDANHVKATHWAGFVGYKGDAEVRLNSCLYFSNIFEMCVPSENNATFYLPANASSVSLQNCCHTERNWVNKQGTYVEDYYEASQIMTALGKEGWFIDFRSPQWQSSEGPTRALVFPRYDYHTALPGNIEELKGSGTATDPYLISSSYDWSVFATNINNNVGTDAYYQLTEDIAINHGQKVGRVLKYFNVNDEIDEHRAFRGTFDGNGHTLTLDMWAVGECAPLVYAHDCTIKNLNIDGTISTSGQHVASLIVNASGTVNITDCRSSVTINSSLTGEGNHGGFVAKSSGTTNFEGCLFVGSILGEATYSCGGFVGERTSGKVNITGSIFAPESVTIALGNASDKSATFCRNNGATVTNSYYMQPLHTGQGTALYTVTAAEGIDMSIGGNDVLKAYASGITMKGNGILLDGVYYAPAGVAVPIGKLELITGYSPQDAAIAPSAGTYANNTLTMPAQDVVFQTSTPVALSTYTIHFDANGGTGEAMDNMDFTYGDAPVALTANSYTRAGNSFTGWNTEPDGSGTAYVEGQTVENLTTASGTTITLYAQWEPWIAEGFGKTDSYTPDGTADYPYVISTTEEWNLLCNYIGSNKGELASSHYRLGNNLTVSHMLGTASNPFRGTFEGAARTLTLDLTGVDAAEAVPETTESSEDPENPDNSEEQQLPESIELPDIPHNPEDVPVEETLHALAPFAYVNGATIKNLHTAGTINGETSYYAAGIVGKAEGNTTLQSCYSSVAITSTANEATLSDGRGAGGEAGDEESPMIGGIVALSTGTLNFTDCLFDGSIHAENTSHCGGFLGRRVSGSVRFINCLMDGELNCISDGSGTYYQADQSTSDYTITNSYYHTAYGVGQGSQTGDTGEALRSRLGESWKVTDGGDVLPLVCITNLSTAIVTLNPPYIPYTGSDIKVIYSVKNFYGEPLTEGTDYIATIKDSEGRETTVNAIGDYTLHLTGTGDYMGSKVVSFLVYKSDGKDFPFQIDNDFRLEDDGYFYVNLPLGGYSEDVYDEEYNWIEEIWHDAEKCPKMINVPAGFNHNFKVYDCGGKNMGYDWGPFDDYDAGGSILTLNCPEGYLFKVDGYINTEDGCDYVSIFDGNSIENDAIAYHISSRRDIKAISSGNSITFLLLRDGTEDYFEGMNFTVSVVAPPQHITLANNDAQLEDGEKNQSVISAKNGEEATITIGGRTLYKDGSWNTLCLPFDIADVQLSPLKDFTIRTLSTTEFKNGKLTISPGTSLTSIEAGRPYILKWNSPANPPANLEDPTFKAVIIKDQIQPVTHGCVSFIGSYSSLPGSQQLFDAHNTSGDAFHASLSLPDIGWYADAECTTPATSIPFATDGTVTLYYKQNDLTLVLNNDDAQVAENEKNASIIAANDNRFACVALAGRTLYKDETWNTLCLPFDIEDIDRTPLRGGVLKKYTSTEYTDGKLSLNFEDANSIEAGNSYIVKWNTINLPLLNASDDIIAAMDFVREYPTVTGGVETLWGVDGSENFDKLVDGNTSTKYAIGATVTVYVDFHYASAITPKGYALWTANDSENSHRNPTSWTIKAKNLGDADWTTLTTVDNSKRDELPNANNACSIYELDNHVAYQYFRFEAAPDYGGLQLAELKFFTGSDFNSDIVNPVFEGVTIKDDMHRMRSALPSLNGSYSTLDSTEGLLHDAHNANGNAFHASLSLQDFNLYTDARLTTPLADAIPFNASTGNVTLYPAIELTINNNDSQAAEDEKNTAVISNAASISVGCIVTLADRTLYKDGDWNTLCLPFNLGNPEAEEGHYFDGTLLEGATVKTLASTEFADGTLTMNFVDVHEIIAGAPYIVKWEGDGSNNLVNPVFTGVTIDATMHDRVCDLGDGKSISLVGNYSPVVYAAGTAHKDVLFLGSGSTLYYPDGTNATTINSCRAYFQLNGISAGDPNDSNGIKAFKLNFGDGETTGVEEIVNGKSSNSKSDDAWYDLQGRRMKNEGMKNEKLTHGLYIHNGKKVIIK